jgi:hypothetical protein
LVEKTMSNSEAVLHDAEAAETAERVKTALTAGNAAAMLKQWRGRARDLTTHAGERARGEIARRRSAAAATLESLAESLRPPQEARRAKNRRTLAIAGGSTLALSAALGAGVALGMYLSRRQAKKASDAAEAAIDESVAPRDPLTGVKRSTGRPAAAG